MALGKTVGEVLDSMDSYELSQWEAYEKASGPLGFGYSHMVLAAIQEQLQVVSIGLAKMSGADDLPEVVRFPKPTEIYAPPPDDETDDDTTYDIAEFDVNFQ